MYLYNNTTRLIGVRSKIFITVEGELGLWKGKFAFYNNSAGTIQSMLYGAQYVTQVSVNYNLVNILKFAYIYSPNRRLVS